MDPLSLAFSLAGIIPLVASALKHARDYRHAVVNRHKSIADLIAELKILESGIRQLQRFLDNESLRQRRIKFSDTSVLRSCCVTCEAKLRDLCRKLAREGSSRFSRYVWPLTEEEHRKTIQSIRNFATWMQFALTVEGCSLLAHGSEELLKLLARQLEQFQVIDSIQLNVQEIRDAVGAQTHLLESSKEKEDRRELLDWISTTVHDQKHLRLQATRPASTGAWITKREEYLAWSTLNSPRNVLWYTGFQGSGKTHLVSSIIDELLEHTLRDTGSHVAYFYFDYQDQPAPSPNSILKCILKQLVGGLPDVPAPILDLFHGKKVTKGSLPQPECERFIRKIAKSSTGCFLIFDALDEYGEEGSRIEMLQSIERLCVVPQVRVLLTSRPHVGGPRAVLPNAARFQIQAHSGDIRLYVQRELATHGVAKRYGLDFASSIVERLAERANGMFLLPVLQLRTVLQEPTLGEMEDALDSLSYGLTDAFAETTRRIQSLPGRRRRLGLDALMWVSHAKDVLTESVLVEVLAMRSGMTFCSPKYRPAIDTVLECCQGFLVFDTDDHSVRLAHFTIQEYLLSNASSLFQNAQVRMAQACLKYLSMQDFAEGPCHRREDVKERMFSHPFLTYASTYWGKHVRELEGCAHVIADIKKFLASPFAPAVAVQVNRVVWGYVQVYYDSSECRSLQPIHHASQQGLAFTINEILEREDVGINARTKMGATPIIFAAANNHVTIMRSLLHRGANPYMKNWYGNALHCAIEAGHTQAIRELVSWGMKLDDPRYLECTLANDRDGAAELLVQLGIADQQPDGFVDRFFLKCVSYGSGKITQLMVRGHLANLDVRYANSMTAMHKAAQHLDATPLRALIESGAKVSPVDDHGRTPLDYAVKSQNWACVELLQKAGAVSKQRASSHRVK